MSGTPWEVECKSPTDLSAINGRAFESLAAIHGKKFVPVVAYMGDVQKEIAGIHIIPWQKLIQQMGL